MKNHVFSKCQIRSYYTKPDRSEITFTEIQTELQNMLDIIEINIIKSFEILTHVTDKIVNSVELLGLTYDDDNLQVDRCTFWKNLNDCWAYGLNQIRTPKNNLQIPHIEHIKLLIKSWCNVLEKFGLVDYEMGLNESQFLLLIDESMNDLSKQNGTRIFNKKNNKPSF